MKCSFCGETLKPGTGKMLITARGEIKYFCSSKCEKNWMLGRDPRKVRWTKIHKKLKGKE